MYVGTLLVDQTLPIFSTHPDVVSPDPEPEPQDVGHEVGRLSDPLVLNQLVLLGLLMLEEEGTLCN